MAQPTWLAYSFAVVMVVVSLYCVGWLVAARRRSRPNHMDVNISHVAMGLAMAGMLVPRLKVLPDGAWEAVFVAIALWFSWHGARFVVRTAGDRLPGATHGLSHYLIHLVMALAMLYMYMAAVPAHHVTGTAMVMTGPTGTGANFVGLPLVFVVVLFASAIWQLDGLSRFTPTEPDLVSVGSPARPAGAVGGHAPASSSSGLPVDRASARAAGQQPSLAPRLEMGCHIAMCVTMGYMLVLML